MSGIYFLVRADKRTQEALFDPDILYLQHEMMSGGLLTIQRRGCQNVSCNPWKVDSHFFRTEKGMSCDLLYSIKGRISGAPLPALERGRQEVSSNIQREAGVRRSFWSS
jgi:hypothetical protein